MKSAILVLLIISVSGAMSLSATIRQSISRDPSVRLLKKEIIMSRLDTDMVSASYAPKIDISSFVGLERSQTPANEGKAKNSVIKNIDITGNYNLFSGHKESFEMKEKIEYTKLAKNKLLEKKITLAKEVSVYYLEVLKKYYIYREYIKSVKKYRKLLSKMSKMVKVGGGKDSDLVQTRARMNFEQTSMLLAKQEYRQALLMLEKYIGRKLNIRGMKRPKIGKLPSLKHLINKVKRYNTSLGALLLQKNILNHRIGIEKSNLYPTIDLKAQGSISSNQFGIRGINKNVRIVVAAKYRLYDGGATNLAIEKARLKVLRMSDAIQNAQREIVANIKNMYIKYKLYKERIHIINQHISNAKKAEKLYTKEEEETGGRSIVDILNIQREYSSAKIAKIDSKYTAMQIYFELLGSTPDILKTFHIYR